MCRLFNSRHVMYENKLSSVNHSNLYINHTREQWSCQFHIQSLQTQGYNGARAACLILMMGLTHDDTFTKLKTTVFMTRGVKVDESPDALEASWSLLGSARPLAASSLTRCLNGVRSPKAREGLRRSTVYRTRWPTYWEKHLLPLYLPIPRSCSPFSLFSFNLLVFSYAAV